MNQAAIYAPILFAISMTCWSKATEHDINTALYFGAGWLFIGWSFGVIVIFLKKLFT